MQKSHPSPMFKGVDDEVSAARMGVLPVSPEQWDSNEALAIGKPRRVRRPNVKCSTDEYNISAVSVTHQTKLVLSGLIVSRSKQKQKNN